MAKSNKKQKAPAASSILSKIWAEIDAYDQLVREFQTNGDRNYRTYINKPLNAGPDLEPGSRFDLTWSMTQLLQPIMFSQMPKPWVERRFKDKDPQGRRASQELERCISSVLGLQDSVGTFKLSRDDYLLTGLGQLWLRYDPQFVKVGDPEEQEEGAEELEVEEVEEAEELPGEELKYENVAIEYIHWKDFGFSDSKHWSGVKSVWKHTYLTKKDAADQLGEEAAEKLKYTYSFDSNDEGKRNKDSRIDESALHKRAKVTEFWDKDRKKVYWVSDGCRDVLVKEKDDFLQLKGFFPCPKPLLGTRKSDSLVPVSDFTILKYLLDELDLVTRREAWMVDAMKASGVSSGSVAAALKDVFESDDNVIKPIKDWLTLKQQGGTHGGAIEWLPLEMFAKVLEQLRARKNELKADVYELSGISDVIRGVTNPYESGKALAEKSQWASQRINERQRLMQEFIRDTVNIAAEIISEHFADESIYEMAGVENLGPEYVDNFVADISILRNDITRNFRIDVEIDSLVQADEEKEKAAVNEYLNAMAQLMGQSQQILMVMPELKPVVLEALKIAARRYRAGRTLEGLLDTIIDESLAAEAEAKANPQPPQPSPEQMLAQFEADTDRMKVESKAQADMEKNAHKQEMDQVKLQHQIQMDQAKLEIEKANLQVEQVQLQMRKMEIESAERTSILKIQSESQSAAMKDASSREQALLKEVSSTKQALMAPKEEEKVEKAEQKEKAAPPVINVTANIIAPSKKKATMRDNKGNVIREAVIEDVPS